MKVLPAIFILLFFSKANGQDFFDFVLPDPENSSILFSQYKSNKATVVIFLLTDCPASENYTLTLNKLSEKFKKDNVTFLGVFPGTYSTANEIKSFQKNYKIGFQLLQDPEMKLAAMLKATVAPGCFLLNEDGNVVYSGRIDDWLYALGKKRPVITQHNLRDAIQSVVESKTVKISQTIPIGCFLENYE